jgi:hypothetical protein
MSTRRKKKLLAAWAGRDLLDAVDRWRGLHPGKSVSDFLTGAMIEKLERDGIEFDKIRAVWDERTDPPTSYFVSTRDRLKLNEKPKKIKEY